MSEYIIHIQHYLPYILIPAISAFVGWVTNVIAIKMTFYPVKFIGIRPFGWQGIIPSKAKKMAETAVNLWTSKLLDLGEEFSKIEPGRVAEEMSPHIQNLSRQIIDEVMEAKLPKLWKNTPTTIRQDIYVRIGAKLPMIVAHMMQQVKLKFNELLDLKYLSVAALTQNKTLLNEVFRKCGEAEFKFIERSGLYFGFLFGLVQMVVWYFYQAWWILPLFGVLVGYFTNYLALHLIFRPLRPVHIGPWKIQGMFVKRQQEVSYAYSHIVASKIITTESIFEYIIRGPGAGKMLEIVRAEFGQTIDETAGAYKPLLTALSRDRLFEHIRNIASFRFMQELPMSIRNVFGYAENALDLENILRTKMIQLSPMDFEAFLRPVFKEDEMTLILVGAALGGLAGLAQFLLLFA